MSTVLEAALCYNALFGWFVFPAPPGSKRSYRSKRNNGQRWGASNNPVNIERFFKRWPKANLGIPTGAVNGFWVLEADTPKGHAIDGIASLRALERQHGRLPKTLMVVSPSGSLHYYFRWPKRGLVVRNSASKIAPGIDVRGEGGMVIAPPSVRDGVGHYRFLNWGTAGADAPDWLLQLVVRKRQKDLEHNPYSAYGSEATRGGKRLIEAALAVIADACAHSGKWPYDTWFEIGCALHFELGDAGFDLFDRWSAASPNYNRHQCVAKWRECGKIGNVGRYTVGTIYHYANEAVPGWRSAFLARSIGWGRA